MPEKLSAKLISRTNLAGSYWSFVFEFEKTYLFSAGQYVSVKVNDEGLRRSYSIASAPGGNKIEILLDVSPMGVGCKFFMGLAVGDVVEALGPIGIFVLDKKRPKEKKMFIATGSGVAPMRSMISDLLINQKYQGELRLIWGMRHEEDLFWLEEWEELKRDFPNFDYHIVLSKPGEHWHGECGHVGDCLRGGFILKEKDLLVWEFYLCGGQDMIIETAAYLQSQGVAKQAIHFEKFF
jgi:ferredoxin-NADP reductase